MTNDILTQLTQVLQTGDATAVSDLTKLAIDQSIGTKIILDDGLIAGMNIVGERFKKHEIFLPDLLFSAKAFYAGLEHLKPLLLKEKIASPGKVVIGTVQGDQHDIGKNLVGIMLEGAGFEVVDLGKDVSPEQFVDAAVETNADVIGMSALLTTTMPVMKKVIDLATERKIKDQFKYIVGGAPLSDKFAKEIGADAYCFDTVSAVECVKGFVKGK